MSTGFVTETELAEARRRRQEEWEKVRSDDQPLERPEEPYDGRSLFEKLKEQKLKKDLEYEEEHKLKNLIRGLDDDEVEFLDLVDRTKMNAEKQNMLEEEKELQEFRNRVATIQKENQEKRIQAELAKTKLKPNYLVSNNAKPTQKELLMGIKRKNCEINTNVSTITTQAGQPNEKEKLTCITTAQFNRGSLKCIGILPGLGPYNDSSDSEISSGSEDEPDTCGGYDLIGVKRLKKKGTCGDEDE